MPTIGQWHWLDTTGDNQFSTPGNWQEGTVPTSVGNIFFSGSLSNDPCDGAAGSFHSMTFQNGYSGTVTLGGSVSLLNYTMSSGTLDQSATTALTVTTDFEWTGGTINSTATLSQVNISGATALIAPSGAGTVSLGSTLNFTGGAVADIEPGTIDAQNDPEIDLDSCQMTVNTYTLSTNVVVVGVTQINLKNAADTFTLTGPGVFNPSNAAVSMYNTAGTVLVNGGGTLSLGGSVSTPGGMKAASYYQTGGALQILSGSTVRVASSLWLNGGNLTTLYNSALANTVAAQTATIDGNFAATGGTILVCAGGPPTRYGTLAVTGTMALEGTVVYQPYIDGTTSGVCDQIVAAGLIYVNQQAGSTATITPSDLAGNSTVASGTWSVIRSSSASIAGTMLTSGMQYFAGPPARSLTYGTLGTPVTAITLNS
ncbi:MAG TPA: hypothetical protein VH092_20630 [Urbifossiella sp.]|nr:hypothetical protein [Urbifossiella sp.]